MGLYSTFSTSQYYDNNDIKDKKPKKEINEEKVTNPKIHNTSITEEKRKSLYDEAVKYSSRKMNNQKDSYFNRFRVGQMIAVQTENGLLKTSKGRIAEIAHDSLMYVYDENSHKDVNGNYMVEYVTGKDKIFPL